MGEDRVGRDHSIVGGSIVCKVDSQWDMLLFGYTVIASSTIETACQSGHGVCITEGEIVAYSCDRLASWLLHYSGFVR